MSYGTYTGLTKLILILWIIYWYYRTYYCISDIEVPVGTTEHFNGTKVHVGTTEQIRYRQNLLRYRSTRRYYRTRSETGLIQIQDLSDKEVPVGTTGLIQRQDLSDKGVPVGTTGLIQRQDLSDKGVPVGTTGLIQRQDLSDTGVPVGTTGLIKRQDL